MMEGVSEETTPFLSLHLHGARFDAGPGMPVEALPELVSYRDLVAAVARHVFLQQHSQRRRVPKGFMESFQLRIRHIGEGSAVAVLERAQPGGTLVAPPDAFDAARDLISKAIETVAEDHPVPENFPQEALVLFNRFGTGLLDDESIELRRPDSTAGPRLTQQSRKRLLAQRPQYLRDAVRSGLVVAIEAERMRFQVRLADGGLIWAPLDAVTFDGVKAVLEPAGLGPMVSVHGVGVFDKGDRLVQFDSVHEIAEMGDEAEDAKDEVVGALGEAVVEAGWLDGIGNATDPAVLSRAQALFAKLVESGALVPRVYPVPDGGLQAEWTIGGREVSVNVEPGGSLYVISVDTGSGKAHDLTIPEGDAADQVLRLLLDSS